MPIFSAQCSLTLSNRGCQMLLSDFQVWFSGAMQRDRATSVAQWRCKIILREHSHSRLDKWAMFMTTYCNYSTPISKHGCIQPIPHPKAVPVNCVLISMSCFDMKNKSSRAGCLCRARPMALRRNFKPEGPLQALSLLFCPFLGFPQFTSY